MCHNEGPRVGPVIDELHAAGLSVLVVDDGSTDDTESVARAHGARVARHAVNRGYGAAVRTAIGRAVTEWVAVVDGDGQFGADAVTALIAASAGADAVWGIRAPRADALGRRIAGRLWRLVTRLALGLRLRDVDCGAKLVRRAAVPARLRCDGPGISAELAAALGAAQAVVHETVVHHRPRRGGRASGLTVGAVTGGLRELATLTRRA